MKKLSIEIISLCDYTLIAQNNKPSLIGIFTELGVQQFPGGIPQAVLFATIKGESNTTYKLTFETEGKKGKVPFPPLEMDIQASANGKFNMNINIGNFVFPEPDEYIFAIYNGKELVGSTALTVFQSKQNVPTYEHKSN